MSKQEKFRHSLIRNFGRNHQDSISKKSRIFIKTRSYMRQYKTALDRHEIFSIIEHDLIFL